ncbi:MAG: PAS domain S-box protein [Deltaproteobacteria bacterium]|nr:PAS domain S-box protein [Deltaproteobacteria bacterium]
MSVKPTHNDPEKGLKKPEKEPLTGLEAEKNLEWSEKKFRHLFEHSPMAIYLTDLNGAVLDINNAGVELLGFSLRKDIIGLESKNFIYADPEERKRYQKILERKDSINEFETQLRRQDGSIIDVQMTAAVRRNESGHVVGYEGFIKDITAHKKAEKELRASEEKYRTVVETSLGAIYVHQDGVFTFANQRLAEMLGYSGPEEIIGRYFWEFVHPEDRDMVKSRGLSRQRGDFTPRQYTVRGIKKDSSDVWIELRATNAMYMGKPAVVGNFIDITKRKRAEEEIRHLSRRLIEITEEEKRMIARDLHDEFGQALTSLHFDLEALENSIPEGQKGQKQRCGLLINQVEKLADNIRKTTAHLRPDLLDHLGLVPTLEWYINDFAARRKEIEVNFQAVGFKKRLESQTEIVLYRILQECLNNISKHAKAKHVNIMLTYSYPKVIFIIKDDGVGYEQADDGLPWGILKEGIGLLSMRERVASLRGTIDINSTLGRGTVIRVELPWSSRIFDE